LRFEALNPLPAGRLRKPDAIGQFGDRNVGVVLQGPENFAVDGIHFSRNPDIVKFDQALRIAEEYNSSISGILAR
jgi:hypothetical protein